MDLLNEGLEAFRRAVPPPLQDYWVAVLAAIAVFNFILISVIGICCLRGKSKGRNVCLLGLSDSGKTLLFLQLKFGTYGPTQNSIKENTQQYEPSNIKNSKPVTLIDIPGSERVRDRIFAKYKESLRGVVLVVDSLNFTKEAHDVAELLYDLFSDAAYHKNKAPLLIACNKQDMALASTTDNIMTTLEKQITQLRVSRQAKPSALDGGPKSQRPVNFFKKGKEDFKFTDLPSWIGVQCVGCSARGQGAGSEGVTVLTSAEGEGGAGKGAQVREVQDWLDGLCY